MQIVMSDVFLLLKDENEGKIRLDILQRLFLQRF